MGGKASIIEGLVKALGVEAPAAAKKAAKPFFEHGSPERNAALDAFYGGTHPNHRQRYFTGTSKDKDFTAFQESRHGTWLTNNPSEAGDYALQNDSQNLRLIPGTWNYEQVNSASRVIPAHARVENPYTGELPDFAKVDNYKKAQSDWFDTLRAQGYDAWAPDSRKGDLVVVLKDQGTNIKSATGNAGTFDRSKKHMGYASGGIIRDVIGAVAKGAPKLESGVARAGRKAVLNIGLDIPGGGRIVPEEALAVLERVGIKPVRATVAQSDTEPTLVLELPRSLAPEQAHQVSTLLQQEAIAQVDETGAGDLFGPGADKWKPFNGDYFINPSGKRFTEEVMDFGDPNARPGGAEVDPVVERMNEVLRGLKTEEPAYAGGGVVKKAVSGAAEEWDIEFEPGSALDKLRKKREAERAEKAAQGAQDAPVINPDDPPQKFDRGGAVYKLGKGLVDMLDFSGVAGKPKTVKIPGRGEFSAAPIGEIDDAAEAYMRKHGIPGTHRIDQYPEFDEEFARRIANEFDGLKHDPSDPAVRRTYDALLDETMAQYRALKDTGLDIKFLKDGMDDPYGKSPSMGYADMVDNGRLWVFPTSQGYGSGAETLEHPLLKKVGKVGDLDDAVANDAFRVVHDAYGHFGPGNPFFRAPGEDRAWQHHARMFTDEALPAMSAETRGQNSWVNSGPHALANKGKSGADTIYADQKAAAMPSWVYERDLGRKIRGFADGGPVMSDEDIASMTHDQSYGTGVEPNHLRTMGYDIPLGDMNFYDDAEGRHKPEGVQGLHDVARMGIYAVPGGGALVGSALDATEGYIEDDPLQMALGAAGGVPGKVYKAVGKAAWDGAKKAAVPASALAAGSLAATVGSNDAEAGVFGRLAKWGSSEAGQYALRDAMKMTHEGADYADIMKATGWFKDLDGHWKYYRPSKGGSLDLSQDKGRLGDVLYDPHLFEEYPDMKDMGFRRKNNEGAHYSPTRDEIVLGDTSKPGYNTPEAGGKYGAVLHETYHGKAQREGWPQGIASDDGKEKVTQELRRFLNSKHGSPTFNLAADLASKNNAGSGLGFARYEAEMGEALARREQLLREAAPGQFKYYVPSDESYIDMPIGALFHPSDIASPEQYRALLQHLDDKAVANDMKAAQGEVYWTNPNPKTGKKK